MFLFGDMCSRRSQLDKWRGRDIQRSFSADV